MKRIKDYHDFYLKWDDLFFADVFEKLRYNSLKNYGLYYSLDLNAPASSWDAVLNMTKGELELISNANIHLFFENYMKREFLTFPRDITKTPISI